MKKNGILLGISLFVGVFFISCDKEKTENPITGKIIEYSGCKYENSKSATLTGDYGPDTSCVYYSYNFQDKKLTLNHINAGFNCCPGNLSCEIELLNDTIRIKEKEETADCDCNCLFDLTINVFNIESEKYWISIDEPYGGDQEKIVFEIDLAINPTGEFLITRKGYPWAM